VYLNEIWPSKTEIQRIVDNFLDNNMFKSIYSNIFKGNTLWNDLKITRSEIYSWDENSTYIREPPFFIDFNLEIPKLKDIKNARVIAMLGDSITTDHISPAGSIPSDSPAGQYLISKGVNVQDFNSFGSRRGNHEVMMRGTFGNIRLKNRLTPNKEGGWTIYFPTMTEMTIYEAAMKYKEKSIPLIIIAGKESNLIGMGVLPLQFKNNENADSLGLKGEFIYDIIGINNIKPNSELTIIVKNKKDDEIKRFNVIARLDTLIEIEYYRNGGILQTVLRNILKSK
ncbi:MAG: aconitate hydratase, partial [Candidatus Helarchaeota archaeon]